MSGPGIYNINFVAGDSVDFTLTLMEDDGLTPRNLTGWVAKAQIRTTAVSPNVLATFTIKNAPLTTDGVIALRLEAVDTNVFRTQPTGVWDLEITQTSDETKQTIIAGSVAATMDVTKDT